MSRVRAAVIACIVSMLAPLHAQEYLIDAMEQGAFAISEAELISKAGFAGPVFLIARKNDGTEILVFRSEASDYSRKLRAKFYSPGDIASLHLYSDPERNKELASLKIPPPVNAKLGSTDKLRETPFPALMKKTPGLRGLRIQLPDQGGETIECKLPPELRLFLARFFPLLFVAVALPLLSVVFSGKSRRGEKRPLAPILSGLVCIGAAAFVVAYNEKPSLYDIRFGLPVGAEGGQELVAGAGYSYRTCFTGTGSKRYGSLSLLILSSSGYKKIPLDSLKRYRQLRFSVSPVIVLGDGRKYSLDADTKTMAWAYHE